jgi:coenzyme F420-dependent glucose-6-phosphate dehydrogenase
MVTLDAVIVNIALPAIRPDLAERAGARAVIAGRLWTEDRVTFEGSYYRTEKATIYDRPERPVPVYLAGSLR